MTPRPAPPPAPPTPTSPRVVGLRPPRDRHPNAARILPDPWDLGRIYGPVTDAETEERRDR